MLEQDSLKNFNELSEALGVEYHMVFESGSKPTKLGQDDDTVIARVKDSDTHFGFRYGHGSTMLAAFLNLFNTKTKWKRDARAAENA